MSTFRFTGLDPTIHLLKFASICKDGELDVEVGVADGDGVEVTLTVKHDVGFSTTMEKLVTRLRLFRFAARQYRERAGKHETATRACAVAFLLEVLRELPVERRIGMRDGQAEELRFDIDGREVRGFSDGLFEVADGDGRVAIVGVREDKYFGELARGGADSKKDQLKAQLASVGQRSDWKIVAAGFIEDLLAWEFGLCLGPLIFCLSGRRAGAQGTRARDAVLGCFAVLLFMSSPVQQSRLRSDSIVVGHGGDQGRGGTGHGGKGRGGKGRGGKGGRGGGGMGRGGKARGGGAGGGSKAREGGGRGAAGKKRGACGHGAHEEGDAGIARRPLSLLTEAHMQARYG